jgi:hypothetical protein
LNKKEIYLIAVAFALMLAGTITVGFSFYVMSDWRPDWRLHSILFWTGGVVQVVGMIVFFYAAFIRKLIRSKQGNAEVTSSPRDEARTQ